MAKSKKKKDWRVACQQEMKKAALKETKARSGQKKPAFVYRWEHVKAVVNQAKKLAKLTNADAEIVEAAAWLHDVKKFEDGANHAKAGAIFALEFLPKTDFPKKKIEAVAHAIAVHTGLWRDKPLKNLEAQVLWDADKLTKVGLTRIFQRIPAELIREEADFSTEEIIDLGLNIDWQDKTVASFHTIAAKKAGQARLKIYRQLWKQLSNELKGKDLTNGS